MMSMGSAGALLVSALGIAPLVLSAFQALRWERDSLAQGQAVLLAQDLSHRLHLNAGGASHYQLTWGQQPGARSCRDAPCARGDWAQADLSEWRSHVGQVLPDGDAWLQGVAGSPPASGWCWPGPPTQGVMQVSAPMPLCPAPRANAANCGCWPLESTPCC